MKKALLVIFIFLINSKIFAEEIVLPKMDFGQVIICALENNNELKAMKYSLKATEKNVGIILSHFIPHVSGGEEFTETNNPALHFLLKANQRRISIQDITNAPSSFNNPGTLTNFLTYGTVRVPIFAIKPIIELKMAKKEYSSRCYMYLRKQEELIKNVSIAYLEIAKAQEYVKVAEQDLKDAEEHLKIANIQYRTKSGLYSDVLRSNTEVFDAEQNLTTAKKNLDIARRALGLLLGLKHPIEITGPTPMLEWKAIDYYKACSVYRNDVKAMEINVENAKRGVRLAIADWSPVMYGTGSALFYNQNYPFAGQSSYILSVFLHWNIFDGGKRIAETFQAKDKSKEAQELLEWLKKNVDFKVFEAFSRVEEANRNYEFAQIALLSAEEGKKMVLVRWKKSLSPFVDVLNSQVNLNKARADLIKTRNNLKAQLITLYYEGGVIRQEFGLDLNN